MTRTLRTVRAHTVDGAHQLVVVDDAGAEHIFTASVTGMEFIHALDVASAGITLGDDENTRIAKDVFDRILEDITTWTVLDPEFWCAQQSLDGQPKGAIVDHDEIYALRIQVSWYDNGWFPSGELSYFRKDQSRLLVSSPADSHGEIVSVVDDGDLGPQLAELGGSYRHDSDWTLVVTRDGHYGELSEFDD
ncbi:hypothetical protein [Gordonia sp. KTR9]|uniref:hypothetical protein n=1 Tax=Gordonia sp. KTR9 TaxID=337191 RepID=UPI0002E6675B|nr:hypothetical protein [Gordonia sp. KTR9]